MDNDAPQTPAVPPSGQDAAPIAVETPIAAPTRTPTSKKKKVMIILLCVVLLIASATSAWYFLIRKTPAQTTAPQTAAPAPVPKVLKPARVIYQQNDSQGASSAFASIPLMGGPAAPITNVSNPAPLSVHENLLVTTSYTGSTDKTTHGVYLSSDGGQTFSAVFQETVPVASDQVGPTITSAIISNDGKKIIFGYINKGGTTNTVREYDIASKALTDLYTTDKIGIFLEAYSPSAKKIFYFSGCYYCDGNQYNRLMMHDLGNNTDTEVYNNAGVYGISLSFNQDLSKAIVVQGGVNEFGMGYAPPYTARELTVATKAFRDVANSTSVNPLQAGYTSDYKAIYYSEGNNVFSVDGTGKKILTFAAEQPIYEVYYVGTDYVVVSVGNDASSSTITFDIAANKATTVLAASLKARVLGIGWE